MKKAGKTTRHDLNQIPYNYTVEVRNRFKGLDLIRVSKEPRTEAPNIVQDDQNHPKETEMQESKVVV